VRSSLIVDLDSTHKAATAERMNEPLRHQGDLVGRGEVALSVANLVLEQGAQARRSDRHPQ